MVIEIFMKKKFSKEMLVSCGSEEALALLDAELQRIGNPYNPMAFALNDLLSQIPEDRSDLLRYVLEKLTIEDLIGNFSFGKIYYPEDIDGLFGVRFDSKTLLEVVRDNTEGKFSGFRDMLLKFFARQERGAEEKGGSYRRYRPVMNFVQDLGYGEQLFDVTTLSLNTQIDCLIHSKKFAEYLLNNVKEPSLFINQCVDWILQHKPTTLPAFLDRLSTLKKQDKILEILSRPDVKLSKLFHYRISDSQSEKTMTIYSFILQSSNPELISRLPSHGEMIAMCKKDLEGSLFSRGPLFSILATNQLPVSLVEKELFLPALKTGNLRFLQNIFSWNVCDIPKDQFDRLKFYADRNKLSDEFLFNMSLNNSASLWFDSSNKEEFLDFYQRARNYLDRPEHPKFNKRLAGFFDSILVRLNTSQILTLLEDPRIPLDRIAFLGDNKTIYEIVQESGNQALIDRLPPPEKILDEVVLLLESGKSKNSPGIEKLCGKLHKFVDINQHRQRLFDAAAKGNSLRLMEPVIKAGVNVKKVSSESLVNFFLESREESKVFDRVIGFSMLVNSFFKTISNQSNSKDRTGRMLRRISDFSKNQILSFLEDKRVDIDSLADTLLRPNDMKKNYTVRSFIQEYGSDEARAGLGDPLYRREVDPEGKVHLTPIVSEHYVKHGMQVVNAQRIASRVHATGQVRKLTGIDLREGAKRHAGERDKSLAMLSPEERKVFARFAAASEGISYYMKHSFEKVDAFNNIMKSGSTLSQHRIEVGLGGESAGLTEDADHQMGSHYFTFFGMGVKEDNLPTPSDFRNNNTGYIIIDADAVSVFRQGILRGLVVKSEDWGADHKRDIVIPGSSLTLKAKVKDVAMPKQGHEVHSPNSNQKYTYETASGEKINYQFPLADEVHLGGGYKTLVPDLIARHLAHLPPEYRQALLAPIKAAQTPEELTKATSDLTHAFYWLEASMPGTLPLRLEYVNEIKAPHHPAIDLRPLRKALLSGSVEEVISVMQPHMELLNYPWIVTSIHEMAIKDHHDNLVRWIEPRMQEVRQQQARQLDIVPDPPRELRHIQKLQHLILENQSKDTRVTMGRHPERLIFTTITHLNKRSTGSHHGALPQLYAALGSESFEGKETLHHEADPVIEIPLDGTTKHPDLPVYRSLDEVRNSLLTRELQTLFVSAQNEAYMREHLQPHPKTGDGASESGVFTLTDQLPFHFTLAVGKGKGYIRLSIEPPKQITKAAQYLKSTLPEIEEAILIRDHQIVIARPLDMFLDVIKNKKFNYQGVINTTTDGDILFAWRRGQGLKTAGGHNSDNYHPGLGSSIELKSEFGLEVRVKRIRELQPIARLGAYCDVALFHIPIEDCRPTAEALNNQNKRKLKAPFKADIEEFNQDTECVLSHQEMRGKTFAAEMPLQEFLIYEEELLNQALANHARSLFTKATIAKDCDREIRPNEFGSPREMQIPGENFGIINLDVSKEHWDKAVRYLKNHAPQASLVQNKQQGVIQVDGINPLKLQAILLGKDVSKNTRS